MVMVIEGDKAFLVTQLAILLFVVIVGGTALYLANKQLKEMKK